MPTLNDLPPLVLPTPRRIEAIGGIGAFAPERIAVAVNLPAEGFRLVIDASGVGFTLGAYGAGMILGALVARRIMGAMAFGRAIMLGPAVSAYLVAISLMFCAAVASGNWWAIAGAGLFVASDSVLGWRQFVGSARWMPGPCKTIGVRTPPS